MAKFILSAFADEASSNFTEQLEALNDKFSRASLEMKKLESGAIKNPDEQRKVTHFTDRAEYPQTDEFREIEEFSAAIRAQGKFDAVVVNGIGGSALGPPLMQFAINGPYWNELPRGKRNGLKIYFLDNTDSSGFADLLELFRIDIAESNEFHVGKVGVLRAVTMPHAAEAENGSFQFFPHNHSPSCFFRKSTAVRMSAAGFSPHSRSIVRKPS